MPGLSAFQMTEPLVEAMVSLLQTNLNVTIDQLNASYADQYTLPHVAQFLPFVPAPSALESGIPAVGVQELGANFHNDIITSTDALHRYAVVAVCQAVDQQTLATQLRRMSQAILFTIQADRLAGTAFGTGGIMRGAGAWSVNLRHYEPGPLLGDLDPNNPEAPPRSYLSWIAIVMESMRAEQVNAGP